MAKIVHVCESMAGGVLSVLTTLVNGQLRDGHEVVLIAALDRVEIPENWRAVFQDGLGFLELPMLREVNVREDVTAVLKLRAMLKRLSPDVVHLHSSKAGALGRVASCFLPAKVIYQPHGWAFLRRDVPASRAGLYLWAERLLALLPGTVVACSEGERAAAMARHFPKHVVTIENAISFDDIPLRRVPHGGRARPKIGTCARIAPQKNPGFFAAVANALRDVADFVWVGDGEAPLRSQLEDAGVLVTGWREKHAALSDMSDLDIYIQTSAWEGMPISVIEAMAIGLPVVATDIVGNNDLVQNGETGFLVQTPADMVDKLNVLIVDGALSSKLGEKGRQVALSQYSAATMLRNYYRVYGLGEDAKRNPMAVERAR